MAEMGSAGKCRPEASTLRGPGLGSGKLEGHSLATFGGSQKHAVPEGESRLAEDRRAWLLSKANMLLTHNPLKLGGFRRSLVTLATRCWPGAGR